MRIASVVALALAMSPSSSGALAQGTVMSSAPRPPLLEADAACEVWDGKASGNDPSVEVSLELCPSGDEVIGVFQWSSTTSGWNRRAVAGRYTRGDARLQLRDTRLIEEKPAPGWRFCVIDSYELERTSPDVLKGTYRSEACDDRATVSLKRRAEPKAGDASAAMSEPRPPAPATTPSAAPTPPASSGSRCSAALGAHGPASLVAPLSLAAALLARGRRRRNQVPSSSSR
jgi:hypothetical protein